MKKKISEKLGKSTPLKNTPSTKLMQAGIKGKGKRIFKVTVAENLPHIIREMEPQLQEVQEIHIYTSTHIHTL